jgi:hypothetical protein
MALQDRRESLGAIALAAGQGTRLSTLRRALRGCDLPKQLAALRGGRICCEGWKCIEQTNRALFALPACQIGTSVDPYLRGTLSRKQRQDVAAFVPDGMRGATGETDGSMNP